ncbi:MAG: lytic transglycosylase domain-containing protein [Acidobacteriota bacterium]|nr:lytic transglycosylase domain-containing protein [Acidobacteriota bacterium]
MPRLLSAALALGLLCWPAASRAELVVFEDGRVVKAASYQVRGSEVEIRLPGGGSYSVDLDRVERIVDDEVILPPAAVAEARPPAGAAVTYDMRYQAHRKPLFKTRYDSVIDAEAKRYDVDAAFVSALIRAESNYEPRAVSRKGARGLMQLMPATARRLDVQRPFDPASNVRGGVRYLRELLDRFDGKPELVLAAYNAGENAVESYGGVPPYRETVGYVKRILSWWTPAVLTGAGAVAAER